EVNVHGLFYEVSADGDTSAVADSIYYLKPYMGKILVAESGPPAPEPSTPASGASVSTSPTLCVSNADHTGFPDPFSYLFEIAEDQSFTSVIRQSSFISEGSGTTCFTTSAPLTAGRLYYWRCRDKSGTATSSWSSTRTFTTPNNPPSPPTGSSPANGSTSNASRPTLTVNNGTDPEGASLTYYFEVSKYSNFSSLAAQSSAVTSGSTTSSWVVSSSLENLVQYFWRVRAYDNIEYSSWSPTMSFTLDVVQTNNPPSVPTVYSPPDNATLTYISVSLSWNNSIDQDGDPLTYEAQLYDSAGSTLLESTSGISQGTGPTTSHSPSYSFTNATWYRWQVRAFDGNDYSGWMTTADFYLDTLYGVNQPPNAPMPISPNNLDTMISLQVSLSATPSYDPESDVLTYNFVVYSDSLLSNLIENKSNLTAPAPGNNIIWPITEALSSGSRYFWSCRASDGNNYSPWATTRSFWVFDFSVNVNEAVPVNEEPKSGATVHETQPRLSVANIISAYDENLYYFEVSEDSTFINRLFSGPIEENPIGYTDWEVAVPLESDKTYYWRSRANNSPYSKVFAFTIDANIIMAPNPFQPFVHDQVSIFNMDPEGTLTITTVANEVVRVIHGNASGQVIWDVTSSDGQALASDVYLCYYKDKNTTQRFKFAVIK
ncbi:MAG: hypothetical protein GY841_04150, partial [FCB group bacterium]|nr:hypothetical protein [FCB group bacterium]